MCTCVRACVRGACAYACACVYVCVYKIMYYLYMCICQLSINFLMGTTNSLHKQEKSHPSAWSIRYRSTIIYKELSPTLLANKYSKLLSECIMCMPSSCSIKIFSSEWLYTSGIRQHLMTAFLSLHLLALPGSSAVFESEGYGTSHFYPFYMKFEEALVKNKSSLYELRDLFFSPDAGLIREVQCFNIELCITAMNGTDEYDFGCVTYQWSNSFLSAKLSADILAIFEPLYTALVYNYMIGSLERKSARIHLNLSSLDSFPTNEYICSASELLVTWVSISVCMHAYMTVYLVMRYVV